MKLTIKEFKDNILPGLRARCKDAAALRKAAEEFLSANEILDKDGKPILIEFETLAAEPEPCKKCGQADGCKCKAIDGAADDVADSGTEPANRAALFVGDDPQPRNKKAKAGDGDGIAGVRPREKMLIHATARRFGTVRNFAGARDEREEKAYRFGMWWLACRGAKRATEFCENNGIPVLCSKDQDDDILQKVHKENVNYSGGYLVPPEFDADLIDLREQYGVFRRLARVSPMMSDTKQRRRRSGGLTAYFVAEGAAGTESTKSWDMVSLTAKKLMVLATFTNELNADAAISIGDDLAGEIAYAFANKEDECGFNGDGTSTYGGVLGVLAALKAVDGTIGNIKGLYVGSGNAYSELVLADFNGVVSILPQYADSPNARWIVHKVFWGTVMQKLVYAAGGNTVEMLGGPTGKTFLGYPVEISQVMPKTAADSQVCALLGDLRLAADFGDRAQTSIAFSEHASVGGTSVFETDEVAIRGTERFDINVHDVGNTTDAGPIVGLITAAS